MSSSDVDNEINVDAYGLPLLHGRTLKGLFVDQAGQVLEHFNELEPAAKLAFGFYGQGEIAEGQVIFGDASLAPDLAIRLREDVRKNVLSRSSLMQSLTRIRHQTAQNAKTGAPRDRTLRATRVLNKGLKFYAPITLPDDLYADVKRLLAACALGMRRVGLSRNRGLGRVAVRILDLPLDPAGFSERVESGPDDLRDGWLLPEESEAST
jgi:CRISPR-associated protein Csx10